MRKGRLILQSILFLMAVLISNGCSIGVKDEPMPLSQENIEKYASAAGEAAKKIDPSAGTAVDKIIKAYKEPMEKKLGYNFDKSFRVWLLKTGEISMSPFINLIAPAIQQIARNTDEALKKGLISQRTYDIIALQGSIGSEVGDESIKWLDVAIECQNANNNVCSFAKFIKILAGKNLISEDILKESNINLLERIRQKVDILKWDDIKGLVSKPDGSSMSMLWIETEPEFVINKEKLELAKKYNQIIKEELANMGKK